MKENDKRQIKQLLEDIKSLKETGVDFIIMYMHSGGQYNAEPTEYTKNLTQFLLNYGVDIVAGSHEHVVHGGIFSDINNNRLATYSLGLLMVLQGFMKNHLTRCLSILLHGIFILMNLKKIS